jgi:HEAT repeat protein
MAIGQKRHLMHAFDSLLVAASISAAFAWAALSLYVLTIERRRAARARSPTQPPFWPATMCVGCPGRAYDPRAAGPDGASREMVMHAAAAGTTPAGTFEVLAAYLVDRWGLDALARDARSHRTTRDKWRRMAALQILFRSGDPGSMALVAAAVDDTDADVASIALGLLGGSADPEAVRILLGALRRQRHPASRVAVQLDRSPQDLAPQLRPMLADADPVVRLWAATLLGRYLGVEGLEQDLAALADDADPRVRKAGVQSLGCVGDDLAAATALRLLVDPVPFVRATAARTIGKLDRLDLAEEIVLLLGDETWWVRFAAKECLEAMGTEVWPVLARSLEHPDRFVRNGAAEVFQNLGLLDSFIVMEAASDNPANAKIDMLRRIVVAFVQRGQHIERTSAVMGSRVRHLLATIGLQQVGDGLT